MKCRNGSGFLLIWFCMPCFAFEIMLVKESKNVCSKEGQERTKFPHMATSIAWKQHRKNNSTLIKSIKEKAFKKAYQTKDKVKQGKQWNITQTTTNRINQQDMVKAKCPNRKWLICTCSASRIASEHSPIYYGICWFRCLLFLICTSNNMARPWSTHFGFREW